MLHCCCDNTPTKSKRREGKVDSAYKLRSIVEGSRGRKVKQKPVDECCLWLVSRSPSTAPPVQCRPLCPARAPPTVGRALLHQSGNKEIPHRHAHRPSDGGDPSAGVPCSQVCHVDNKTNQDRWGEGGEFSRSLTSVGRDENRRV